MSLYHKSPSYQKYKEFSKRPPGLPPYAYTARNQVILCAGELWCRYEISAGQYCPAEKFSSYPALKRHIRTHGLEVARGKPGALSSIRQMAVILWYNQLIEVLCKP